MQEDYSDYSDFDIIALDPNVNYETSDDDDDESEMEYEDTVVWNDNSNKMFTADKMSDFETELSDQKVTEEETMCIENNQEEELIGVKDVTIEDEPMQLVENVCANEKPRKKLNLAEYKIRRANKPQSPVEKFDKNVVLELCEIPDSLPILELPTDPRSIKNLLEGKDQTQDEQNLDENSEINLNIQAQSATTTSTDPLTIHPDYEEIVLMSMECQTEISISPYELDEDCEKKSSAGFLTNIVNSFHHSNNAKTILNSTSTLLSSINAVLSEKRNNSSNEVKTKSDSKEHGENKVIMHLRKDRIRPYRNCAAIQTEVSPLFPPLILSPSLIFNRIKNSRNFRRKSTSRSRSRSRSRSISPEHEYYNSGNRRSNYKYSRSVNSSSMNSSEMDSSSESDTSAYSSCRSSDHDSLKRFDNRFKQHGYQRPSYNFQGKVQLSIIHFMFNVIRYLKFST
jgi:hypothetical protein